MKKKKAIKKSITYRKELWDSLNKLVESDSNLNTKETSSYYAGYTQGLFISGKITAKQKEETLLELERRICILKNEYDDTKGGL